MSSYNVVIQNIAVCLPACFLNIGPPLNERWKERFNLVFKLSIIIFHFVWIIETVTVTVTVKCY